MNGYGYVRVSLAKQAEEGVSLEAQQARIRLWCRAQGHDLACIEIDSGLSGGRADNRPALQKVLAAVCKAKGILVVYSLSRLARSTRDALDIAERLHDAGANLVSLSESIDTTTAMGRFFFTVLAALAALERELISERTTMAMRHIASNGGYTGGAPPFGYRKIPPLVLGEGWEVGQDSDEQRIIQTIRFLHSHGQGAASIARTLNGACTPCRGSAWHARSVSRILAREKTA